MLRHASYYSLSKSFVLPSYINAEVSLLLYLISCTNINLSDGYEMHTKCIIYTLPEFV
jgi:hypothetical protein